MRIDVRRHDLGGDWDAPLPASEAAVLVLVFGAPAYREQTAPFSALREAFPNGVIAGCSTAGEIHGVEVADASLVVAIVHFERSMVQLAEFELDGDEASGRRLAAALTAPELSHVLVLSDGIGVNGTELVAGLNEGLPDGVGVSGGLAGDGADFGSTWVLVDGRPESGFVTAVGVYGAVQVNAGSRGGWSPFGIERRITRSEGNRVYAIDGQPALALYQRYLGERASELPAAGLLFPLELVRRRGEAGVVRTILGIDEATQSLTFAGDLPEGSRVRLMASTHAGLVHGAREAAASCHDQAPVLAVAVSCVGRRLVLGEDVDDEVDAVLEALPEGSTLVGYYSYGELSPLPNGRCALHNQTMTLTTFVEP